MVVAVIVIADSGIGNGRSVLNMARRAGFDCELTSDPAALSDCSRAILPGVGAFDAGVLRLRETGWWDALLACHDRGTAILGICLGMQLLSQSSAEGREPGLGIVDARFERLKPGRVKVPHVGWNRVHPTQESELFPEMDAEYRYYFVHSYHAVLGPAAQSLATVSYGDDFSCAYRQDNVYGVQFHPEKSHRFGLALLKGFLSANA